MKITETGRQTGNVNDCGIQDWRTYCTFEAKFGIESESNCLLGRLRLNYHISLSDPFAGLTVKKSGGAYEG